MKAYGIFNEQFPVPFGMVAKEIVTSVSQGVNPFNGGTLAIGLAAGGLMPVFGLPALPMVLGMFAPLTFGTTALICGAGGIPAVMACCDDVPWQVGVTACDSGLVKRSAAADWRDDLSRRGAATRSFGIKGAELLRKGPPAQEALEELIREDENRGIRQLGIVDRDGRSAAYTGRLCYPYANHVTRENFSCQGNVLLGQIALDEMVDTFVHSGGDLAQRLVAALEAVQNAGGERRGQERAALLVRKVTNDELLGEAQTYVDTQD